MLPVPPIRRGSVIVDKASEVREWIKYISEKRGELGGHAICPYAFSASVEILEGALSEVTLIKGVDVVIWIVEDCTVASMMCRVSELNMLYTDYIFLDDHKDEPTYIKGVQSNFGKHNLILCQKKDKLLEARDQLHKTDYYSHWHKQMYKRIIHGKFTNRQEQRVRRVWNDTHHSTRE